MTPDDVNAKGLAEGWHAQALARRAFDRCSSMAKEWRRDVQHSTAFSVPAVCTAVSLYWVEYRFADGSTDRYERPT